MPCREFLALVNQIQTALGGGFLLPVLLPATPPSKTG